MVRWGPMACISKAHRHHWQHHDSFCIKACRSVHTYAVRCDETHSHMRDSSMSAAGSQPLSSFTFSFSHSHLGSVQMVIPQKCFRQAVHLGYGWCAFALDVTANATLASCSTLAIGHCQKTRFKGA